MLKEQVTNENKLHLPYHDHGTKTLFSLDLVQLSRTGIPPQNMTRYLH